MSLGELKKFGRFCKIMANQRIKEKGELIFTIQLKNLNNSHRNQLNFPQDKQKRKKILLGKNEI